jgi:hypothetical protein
MAGKRKLITADWAKLRLYQQFMSMERSLYSAYGALFVAGEGILLSLAFFLKQLGKTEQLWIIAIVGIAFAASITRFFYLTGVNIDTWKNKILDLTEGTDIEDEFKHWRTWWYRKYRQTKGRMRLLWMAVLLIAILGLWCWIVC